MFSGRNAGNVWTASVVLPTLTAIGCRRKPRLDRTTGACGRSKGKRTKIEELGQQIVQLKIYPTLEQLLL